MRRRRFLPHILVVVAVLVCLTLGRWQLRRLDERRALNRTIAVRQGQPVLNLPAEIPDAVGYRRAVAEGAYDGRRQVLLDGRSLGGRPGSHVLAPLRFPDGNAVVVDRGWIPEGIDDPLARNLAPPDGTVRVTGILVPSERRGRFGARDPERGALTHLVRLDVQRLGRQLPYPVAPVALVLQTQEPASSPVPVPASLPQRSEGPHLAYAVQWFLFAAVAAVGYAVVVRRSRGDRTAPETHRP